ncbi:unnamed protein product [Closterium sp. NIES-65]|nr:unnamed protein product [Closterium sp. NIES-65]
MSNKRLCSRELQQGDTNTEAAVATSVSAWGSRLPCVKDEPAPNDALTALLTAPSSTTFKMVSLYNHMGVGSQVTAHDALTLADKEYLGDAVVDFHNMCPNGKSWVALDSKAYAYAKLHKKPIGRCTGPSVFEYDYIAVPVYGGWECGVYMCQYLEALVTVPPQDSRGDLCSHAEGMLIPELQRQGLRIPLQPVPIIDDNGYICVDPPVDIRRELLDHKEKLAVIEHDIQVLTAKIEYLAIRKGVTSDELDAGARQHLGAVVDTRLQVELSDGDKQALAGCTEEILRLLVKYRRWNRWREWRAAMAGLDDAQPVETRSRRKGRVSRAISDVEEVEAITQTTEDQPMAEEPEDRTEDYTDDDESVDDDAVYQPGNDTFDKDDGWEDVNRAQGVA